MLHIIGAGFGRTGTHSLGLALEQLGYGPCYSLPEVMKNAGHNEILNDALDGKPVNWNGLFKSYNSAVEFPCAVFLHELIEVFPAAKVILTTRDADSWYESANKTIFDGLELSAYNPDPDKRARSRWMRRLILEHTFSNRHRDKDYAIAVYQRHIQQVIEMVPAERLLMFNVKDGWEPLCEFLQKPIPEETFPWLNERTEFMTSEPEWAKDARKKISASRQTGG